MASVGLREVQEIAQVEQSIARAEALKTAKKIEREERKFYAELKKKRAIQERMVGLMLLILSVVIGVVMMGVFRWR